MSHNSRSSDLWFIREIFFILSHQKRNFQATPFEDEREREDYQGIDLHRNEFLLPIGCKSFHFFSFINGCLLIVVIFEYFNHRRWELRLEDHTISSRYKLQEETPMQGHS